MKKKNNSNSKMSSVKRLAPDPKIDVMMLNGDRCYVCAVCVCVCSGVGTIAVLYCVVLVTVKYVVHVEDNKPGPIRHQ